MCILNVWISPYMFYGIWSLKEIIMFLGFLLLKGQGQEQELSPIRNCQTTLNLHLVDRTIYIALFIKPVQTHSQTYAIIIKLKLP